MKKQSWKCLTATTFTHCMFSTISKWWLRRKVWILRIGNSLREMRMLVPSGIFFLVQNLLTENILPSPKLCLVWHKTWNTRYLVTIETESEALWNQFYVDFTHAKINGMFSRIFKVKINQKIFNKFCQPAKSQSHYILDGSYAHKYVSTKPLSHKQYVTAGQFLSLFEFRVFLLPDWLPYER